MALTDTAVRNSKPQNKPYTLKDIQGLSLYVPPAGNKSWHFRYTAQGKRHRVSLGQYPSVSLREARERCEDARFLIKNGMPYLKKKEQQQTASITEEPSGTPTIQSTCNIPQVETFAEFCERWKAFKFRKLGLNKQYRRQSTHSQIERYLQKDILPILGKLPMNTISKRDVLKVQRNIEMRGSLSIAQKCRNWLNEIFRHAMAEDIIESNPAADMDILALPQKPTLHNPYLSMDELPEFLARLHHYRGEEQTKLGIYLLLLTGVRTGELRYAKPEQFDLDKQLWNIPPENVKQLKKMVRSTAKEMPPYIVPLSTQAVQIIRQLLANRHPRQPYLLRHAYRPAKVISENTLNFAIQKRLGYTGRLTGHGIRATLSTALNELDYPKQWIEAQLSHSDKDHISATYNHARYVEQRRQMMQEWADRLDQWRGNPSAKA
ncbi:tyrosine-type recombinase/integrase [Saezia sanguinis]|uniref:tyrosine-type recombinase/integrase n=1 Tax=Saezia sanguinis TaxID=1965230 RepID=UPI0030672803